VTGEAWCGTSGCAAISSRRGGVHRQIGRGQFVEEFQFLPAGDLGERHRVRDGVTYRVLKGRREDAPHQNHCRHGIYLSGRLDCFFGQRYAEPSRSDEQQ
jgi:hypothetical protein